MSKRRQKSSTRLAKSLLELEQKSPKKTFGKRSSGEEVTLPGWVIAIIVVAFLTLIAWLLGYASFAVAYIRCGEAPIVREPVFFAGVSEVYNKPGSEGYGPVSPLWGKYLCKDDPEYIRAVPESLR